MSKWHEQAGRRIRALESLTDGMPAGSPPQFGTRGPAEHLAPVYPIRPAGRTAPELHLCTTQGSWAVALAWMVWSAFGLWMILRGGGGGWILWLYVGALGVLRQTSTLVAVTTRQVRLRDGIAGRSDRSITANDIEYVWVRQGQIARLFDFGRLGMRLRSGEIVWSPVVSHPYMAKSAVSEAVSGRRLQEYAAQVI